MDFEKTKKSLEKHGFEVSIFDTPEAAAAYLDGKIDGKTVGIGGSVSLKEMGIYKLLSAHNEVFWHWEIPEGKTSDEIIRRAAFADVYLSSANGIAETGEIINIDGIGNRVAALGYGHEKLYIVAGKNKIAPDFESAMHRARNIAAPKNAKRIGRKTPCAIKADRCYDCRAAERICNNFLVFENKPMGMAAEVVLVDCELGY